MLSGGGPKCSPHTPWMHSVTVKRSELQEFVPVIARMLTEGIGVLLPKRSEEEPSAGEEILADNCFVPSITRYNCGTPLSLQNPARAEVLSAPTGIAEE